MVRSIVLVLALISATTNLSSHAQGICRVIEHPSIEFSKAPETGYPAPAQNIILPPETTYVRFQYKWYFADWQRFEKDYAEEQTYRFDKERNVYYNHIVGMSSFTLKDCHSLADQESAITQKALRLGGTIKFVPYFGTGTIMHPVAPIVQPVDNGYHRDSHELASACSQSSPRGNEAYVREYKAGDVLSPDMSYNDLIAVEVKDPTGKDIIFLKSSKGRLKGFSGTAYVFHYFPCNAAWTEALRWELLLRRSPQLIYDASPYWEDLGNYQYLPYGSNNSVWNLFPAEDSNR